MPPPFHGLGPFLGEVVLGERLQRTHELAVDDAREKRVELAGDGGHRRFVEKGEALRDFAIEDEAARLRDSAHGRCGWVMLRT